MTGLVIWKEKKKIPRVVIFSRGGGYGRHMWVREYTQIYN